MARKTITLSLGEKSIDKAIKELKAYQKWAEQKANELSKRLAEIGANEASVRFLSAQYKGTNDASVSVEAIANGYKIVASGSAVFFIEFGAGVYYNGAEPYPEPRPAGVSGIGEYGKGKGKQKAWGFYDESGELIITHGTPAAMPMYHASRVMLQEIQRIAKEVFAR
jgi:hypothetical protein